MSMSTPPESPGYARVPGSSKSVNSQRSLERASRVHHFPTVSVAGSSTSPASTVRYAVPYRPSPTSSRYTEHDLKMENLGHRVRMLEDENNRLLKRQGDILSDANRRVEMHVNEIRMIKDDVKRFQNENKELRDLCCFLDDDRRKSRQLGKEWHKFGKYTSNLMKQEIQTYQNKLQEYEARQGQTMKENEDLKQLCLYLDEQRQSWMHHRDELELDDEADRHSEDLGCGSSERSSESSERLKPESEQFCVNQLKEHQIRKITEGRLNPESISQAFGNLATSSTDSSHSNDRILNYVQSLESRIKQLERAQSQQDQMWPSSSDVNSEFEEKTVIDLRWRYEDEKPTRQLDLDRNMMQQSMTSTMTSSGTTYASWDTDNESAVYVMGDENEPAVPQLEVRPLPVISEDGEDDPSTRSCDDVLEGGKLPPKMAPLSASTLSVGRLSLCGSDRSHSPLPRNDRASSHCGFGGYEKYEKGRSSSMTDAVRMVRLHELANGSPKQVQDVLKPSFQTSWETIESRSLDKENEQRTAV